MPFLIALAVIAAAAALFFLCDMRLILRFYKVKTDKLKNGIRFCLISDLHNCRYGKNESKLITSVVSNKPDVILLAGDIADNDHVNDNAVKLISALSKRYPCYMALGNHEFRCEPFDELIDGLKRAGARILSGEYLDSRGVRIFGIDDIEGGEEDFIAQLDSCRRNIHGYTVLISHRPTYYDRYRDAGFDLVVCGHMHGGQWRFPGINGLYVPREGLFPKYAGGIYRGKTTMVVSRGLCRKKVLTPRILNRPELVFIDVEGSETDNDQK